MQVGLGRNRSFLIDVVGLFAAGSGGRIAWHLDPVAGGKWDLCPLFLFQRPSRQGRRKGGESSPGGRKIMNGNEVLRIVDAIHRDKNIDKEIVFEGIEQAIVSAARKHFGEESQIDVHIDRDGGS